MAVDRLRFLSHSVLAAIAALTFSNNVAIAGAALDRILEEKQIRLGVRVDAPPFASLVDGRPYGFTVELCGLIAGAIMATSNLNEMSGRLIKVDVTDRFEKVMNGEIDVLCGATTATLTRRESVSFSIPTFMTGIAGLVSENASKRLKELVATGGPSPLSSAEMSKTLEGRVVAARAGTTAESWLRKSAIAEIDNITIAVTDDHRAGIAGVAAGTIDVYFADKAILSGLRARESAPHETLISERTYTNEPYALVLPRHDEEFRLMVDKALSYIYRTGAIFDIYQRHFGKPSNDVAHFYAIVTLPE